MSTGSCQFCIDHRGDLLRLFSSQEEFEESVYYSGESDGLVDDERGALYAIWPGKNNVGRREKSDDPEKLWWLCAPVHPLCGDELFEDFGKEPEQWDDWFSDVDWDKYEATHTTERG